MMYNESKKYISIVYTGGTIGAYIDKGITRAYDKPEELLRALEEKRPEVNTFAELSIKRVTSILSEDMVPSDWGKIAKAVSREINHNYADGIVITHGTDTLPFSSAALCFMLKGLPVPVVLTGSNLPLTAEGTDAVQHLYDSILVASKSDLAGVFVVFKRKDWYSHIHCGTRVRQMQPFEDYFESINNETLGYVKEDKIYLSKKRNFIGESKEYEVYLFYKPDIEYLKSTALTLERAKKLGPYKGKKRLVFAPSKYLDTDYLLEYRIDYCQLPFEIYKLKE